MLNGSEASLPGPGSCGARNLTCMRHLRAKDAAPLWGLDRPASACAYSCRRIADASNGNRSREMSDTARRCRQNSDGGHVLRCKRVSLSVFSRPTRCAAVAPRSAVRARSAFAAARSCCSVQSRTVWLAETLGVRRAMLSHTRANHAVADRQRCPRRTRKSSLVRAASRALRLGAVGREQEKEGRAGDAAPSAGSGDAGKCPCTSGLQCRADVISPVRKGSLKRVPMWQGRRWRPIG